MDSAPTTTEAAALLGLQPSDARVLGHLQRQGMRSVAEVARALGLHRAQAHRSLARLESQGAVDVMAGRPTLYQAVAFTQLVQERMAELQAEQARLAALVAYGALPVATGGGEAGPSMVVRLVGQRAITAAVARVVGQARSSLVVRDETPVSAARVQGVLAAPPYGDLGEKDVHVRALLCVDEEARRLLPRWAEVRTALGRGPIRYVVVDGRSVVLWTDPEAASEARCAILTDAAPVGMLLLDDFERAWSAAPSSRRT